MIAASKSKVLSTVKKDEAAFYLNELARGLLKDRVSIRVGDQCLVLDTFEAMHLEMAASETQREYTVEIRLAWRKPAGAHTTGGAERHPATIAASEHAA